MSQGGAIVVDLLGVVCVGERCSVLCSVVVWVVSDSIVQVDRFGVGLEVDSMDRSVA